MKVGGVPVTVDLRRGPIEYAWIDGPGRPERPPAGASEPEPVVLLHEGLGSVAMWRDFPLAVAEAVGRRVLVYSRYGYGGSGPATLPRPVEYMHREALEVLPELLERLGVTRPTLVGHSDGASIALIAAGQASLDLAGVVVLAPHVFVEDCSVAAIQAARSRYLADGRFRARLGRYHRDPDGAFWGWNDVWLTDAFRDWSITELLAGIDVPVSAVQGDDDPYGTVAQIRAIEARLRGLATITVLPGVGHAPHQERPAETVAAIAAAVG